MSLILVVEDNDMNRDMLARRLALEGFDVREAVDGETGIRLARELCPDLILMDLSLPGIDGWAATRTIKDGAGTAHIPVVALTAHALEGDRNRALRAGCDDYRTKPIDIDDLLELVGQFIGVRPGLSGVSP